MIDTGPDFRQQMLRENIAALDFVLFTHHHKDHIAGLDDIRSYNFRQNKVIPVFANSDTIEQLKNEYSYIFSPGEYGGAPRIRIEEIVNSPFLAEGIPIDPIEVLHHKLPVLGFRIGNLSYITDANIIPETEREKIRGSEILVLNALQKTHHKSHFTLHEALEEIRKINPRRAYLTHLSHRMGLHEEVSKELPDNVFLAHDGLNVEL